VRSPPESQPPTAEVRATLDWFLEVAPDRSALERRIQRAQQHYRAGCASNGVEWPETSRLLLGGDLIACCLAQGFSSFGDDRQTRNAGIPSYDLGGVWQDVNENRAHGRDERVEYTYRLVKAMSQTR